MGGDVGAGGLGDVRVAGDSGRRRRAPVVCNGAWREAGAARGQDDLPRSRSGPHCHEAFLLWTDVVFAEIVLEI